MVNQSFFARWEASHKLTQDTLLAFPEERLGDEIIAGLPSPGEMYCHIYAYVNGILDACLTRVLDVDQLRQIPADVDCRNRSSLLHYARVTMNTLFAHAGQSPRAWQQTIKSADGEIVMESLCSQAYDHEVHHRGQLVAMLKHIKIQPPESVLQLS